MRMRAWLIRSAETTGPIVVNEACSAIGPNSAWSALTISPPLPSVGSWVLPVAVDGEADGAADAPADAAADADGLGDGAELGEGDAAGEPDGAADADAEDAALGEAD